MGPAAKKKFAARLRALSDQANILLEEMASKLSEKERDDGAAPALALEELEVACDQLDAAANTMDSE